jgi:natural resistance-associated macrophage protein 2
LCLVEGDLLAGTHGGYGLIWALFMATFCGLIIQILSARLGVVTGRDLAVLCREQFPKPISLVLWVMTEVAIIGSDIQEVIGTAIAFKILFGFPIWLGAIITILDTFTFLFIHACGVRKLEAFFAVLVGTMVICFWANMFIVRPGIGSIMGGFVPLVPHNSTDELIGLIGAVIMPHNLFLHSSLVQSRKVDVNNHRQVREANKYFSIEAGISLLISFFINMSVVATFAYYHLKPGSGKIYLENAHLSLEQSFGKEATLIWGIGLMAAGQSSTMTGTYAGQFVMQGFINLHMPAYMRVLITRAIAIVPALIVTFIGNLDSFDGYLNILQAVQLPFALIPLLKFSAST